MHLEITKYKVKNPVLRPFINFFWVINSTNANINHKLLPLKNIDLIINLSSAAKYASPANSEKYLSHIYFMGITDKFRYNWILKQGKVDIIGVSFSSSGLYPFVKIPLHEFKNEIVDFADINRYFSDSLTDKLSKTNSTSKRLDILEQALLNLLDIKHLVPDTSMQIIDKYSSLTKQINIEQFCVNHGISSRKVERLFDKYVGINPKKHFRINRFQNTVNQVVQGDYDKLSDLAYDNGYFDQMHFIREFKSFTGTTPSKFLQQKSSLKEISYFS